MPTFLASPTDGQCGDTEPWPSIWTGPTVAPTQLHDPTFHLRRSAMWTGPRTRRSILHPGQTLGPIPRRPFPRGRSRDLEHLRRNRRHL